jgi:hypothetical protein
MPTSKRRCSTEQQATEQQAEWPFGEGRRAPNPGSSSTSRRPRGTWYCAYANPNPEWEALREQIVAGAAETGGAGSNGDDIQQRPASAAHTGQVLASVPPALRSLRTRGAATLRGGGGERHQCAQLLAAMSPRGRLQGEDGVALFYAASHPLVAHSCVMQLCAAALGRQLLRLDSTEELARHMCLPSTFTDGQTFRQFPWELQTSRLLPLAAMKSSPQCHRPPLEAADCVPACDGLENQLSVYWALSGTANVQLISGSHRWARTSTDDGGVGHSADTTSVTLQPGDALVWCGVRCVLLGFRFD